MSYNLFLDDVRNPQDCIHYMHKRIGARNPIYMNETWYTARDYKSFLTIIEQLGNPKFISFDHDLADIHYDPITFKESFAYHEETGYDCAKWYLNYIQESGQQCAEIAVHSMNPVGTENIQKLFENYQKNS